MDTKKLLGKRLKELIKRNGISQEKLAEMVNIEPTALSNIVTGKNFPLFSTLEKILNVLHVSYGDVFKFEHHEKSENLKKEITEILENHPEQIQVFYKILKALIE